MRNALLVLVLGCGGGKSAAPTTPSNETSTAQPAPAANKVDQAKLQVKNFAFEAFPTWAMNNPDKDCPASVGELAAEATPSDAKDPWGTELQMLCGKENLPAGAVGVAILSAGEDLKFGTADDLRSWD